MSAAHTVDELVLPARALTRAAEAAPVPGNAVTILRDGPQVFPAWLADIAAARRFILFENYIINADCIGNAIADALIERARAGVAVHVLYDWFGCIGTSRKLWRRLGQAGVQVRVFNPPRLSAPIHAFQRNHRKSLCIDGRVGFVGGLCVGDDWAGDSQAGLSPWRDTAVRIEGPAAAALCHAFDETWSLCGPRLAPEYLPDPTAQPPGGAAPVRVVSGLPGRSRIYRIIQVLLSMARRRIWITDAYFLTPPTLYEALLGAARDGVDVRVLVPGRSDLQWISWIGRSGFTGLLAAGVRIFEWEGPMLHAKTSVIDGVWCRVGSSNLNLASLLTNWELDVAVEDPGLGRDMEETFLADLHNSSELILRTRRASFQGRIQRAEAVAVDGAARVPPAGPGRRRRSLSAPGGRPGAAVARAGAAVLGVALRRQYEQSAWAVSGLTAALLFLVSGVGLWRPWYMGLVVSLILLWLGISALFHAVSQWRHRHRLPPQPRPRRRLFGRRGYLLSAKTPERPPPGQPL